MRILLINERYISGGTEVQTQREKKALETLGYEVYLLTFDKNQPERKICGEEHWFNIPLEFGVVATFINHTFGSRKYRKQIQDIVDTIKPEFIHINNVFAVPDDVYKVVADYPTMQTIRDYMAICPKATCIDKSRKICRGYKYGNCVPCVAFSPRYVAKYYLMNRLNKRRCAAVNNIVSPSSALANACTKNGIPVTCLNNPFDFSILKKDVPNTDSNIYMYYGKVAEIKGIRELICAFEKFHETYPEKQLWIVGDVDDSFKNEFQKLCNIKNSDFIVYKGRLANNEIMELYKKIYCVVVPSLWIENYPNTVLEALANKTLAIGTNRGGIPELIQDDRFLFDILDSDDIVHKLEYTATMSEKDCREVVEKAYRRVKENNTIERYISRVLEIIGQSIEQS